MHAGSNQQSAEVTSSEASTPRKQDFSIGARHRHQRSSPTRRPVLNLSPQAGKAGALLSKG